MIKRSPLGAVLYDQPSGNVSFRRFPFRPPLLHTIYETDDKIVDLSSVFAKDIMTGVVKGVKFGPIDDGADYLK